MPPTGSGISCPSGTGCMLAVPLPLLPRAARVMVADLARAPQSGLTVGMCGYAPVSNFRLYRLPERRPCSTPTTSTSASRALRARRRAARRQPGGRHAWQGHQLRATTWNGRRPWGALPGGDGAVRRTSRHRRLVIARRRRLPPAAAFPAARRQAVPALARPRRERGPGTPGRRWEAHRGGRRPPAHPRRTTAGGPPSSRTPIRTLSPGH